jgi:hypothetical protein
MSGRGYRLERTDAVSLDKQSAGLRLCAGESEKRFALLPGIQAQIFRKETCFAPPYGEFGRGQRRHETVKRAHMIDVGMRQNNPPDGSTQTRSCTKNRSSRTPQPRVDQSEAVCLSHQETIDHSKACEPE